jgi:hypothetical protein
MLKSVPRPVLVFKRIWHMIYASAVVSGNHHEKCRLLRLLKVVLKSDKSPCKFVAVIT